MLWACALLGVLWVLEDQPAEVLWAWELLEVLWALMMAAWSVAIRVNEGVNVQRMNQKYVYSKTVKGSLLGAHRCLRRHRLACWLRRCGRTCCGLRR